MAAISDEEQERIIKVLREASEIEEKEQERIGYYATYVIQYMHSIHIKECLATLEEIVIFSCFHILLHDVTFLISKFLKIFVMSVYAMPLLFTVHSLHTV